MVSMRCKMHVHSLIESKGLVCLSIDAGEFELDNELSVDDLNNLSMALHADGFQLLDDNESRIIKSIKGIVAELIHYSERVLKIDLDAYLNKKLDLTSADLLLLFSSVKGISILQYFMLQKIERAKELIIYDGMAVVDIAEKLGFDNLAEMQSDFKKLSGLTPDFFENLRIQRLEKIKLCE